MGAVNINDFPLIPITELMDLPSGDAMAYGLPEDTTVENMMSYKWEHITGDKSYPEYKDWAGLDWKQERPVYIREETDWHGDTIRTLANGHHRSAKAHAVGLLFVHYTNDYVIGWDQR